MEPDKRRYRRMKRDLKKAGNRKRRQHLKRDLEANPEEAHRAEFDFGKETSTGFNGLDEDRTRRRTEDGGED